MTDEDNPSSEFDDDALELMREDASKTIDRLMQKHDAHQKKATQILQLNGVTVSVLLAAASQAELSNSPNCLLYIGPSFFLISGIISAIALRGQTLRAGISFDQIDKNVEAELTKTQYLLWYLYEFYGEAAESLYEKLETRKSRTELAVNTFLIGLLITAGGIVIRYA